tara:strand:- start:408 stop:1058 length:651 start_codon:yes stop_codon:yes gene_type:complete
MRISLLTFIIPIFLFPQENLTKIRYWNNIELLYKSSKRNQFSFELGSRFINNESEYLNYFYDLSYSKKHNKNISFTIGVRNSYENFNLSSDVRNRVYFDLNTRSVINKKNLIRTRAKYQSQVKNQFFLSSDLVQSTRKFRYKIVFEKRYKLFPRIYSFFEPFYEIGFGFEKYRIGIGLKFDIFDKHSFNLSFMSQKHIDDISNNFVAIRTKLSFFL